MVLESRLVSGGRSLPLLRRLTTFTAKNIALAGVKSLTIFDSEPVTVKDLGTQVRLYPTTERNSDGFLVLPSRIRHRETTGGSHAL